jgi:hypothetical protein
MDDPLVAEPPDAAVLLPAEGAGHRIIHATVVDVRHAGVQIQRKWQAALLVAYEDGAGETEIPLSLVFVWCSH